MHKLSNILHMLQDAQVNKFHDFRADFFPLDEGIFPKNDVGFDQQNCWDFEKDYPLGPRYITSDFLFNNLE